MMNLNALQRSFPSHRIVAHHGTNDSEHAILKAPNTDCLSVVELHRAHDGGWQKMFEHAVSADEAVEEYLRAVKRSIETWLKSNRQETNLGDVLF